MMMMMMMMMMNALMCTIVTPETVVEYQFQCIQIFYIAQISYIKPVRSRDILVIPVGGVVGGGWVLWVRSKAD